MLAVMLVFTAACGGTNATNEQPNASQGTNTNQEQQSSEENTPEPEAEETAPVIVEHAMGTEEFTSVPSKVVVLEWSLAEAVLALGVQPVGTADIKGYSNWVKIDPKFNADVVDVGTRQEPNLEAIAALQPDLILTVDFRAANYYEQLKGIAPTIVFGSEFEENLKDPYTYMVNTFQTIAEVLGKTEEANNVLANLEQVITDEKQKLADAGKAGEKFVISQAWTNQNAAVMRLFTYNSMASQLLEKVGLVNAMPTDVFQPNGFETADVEGLVKVQDANFLYVAQAEDNPFETVLKDNPVWNGLTFVKEERHYGLGGDMWLFGGPLSAELVVQKAVQLLTQ